MARPIIVSGLSGSGKSTALRALEDAGRFCMDNLPVPLLPKLLEFIEQPGDAPPLAVAIDARDRHHIMDAACILAELEEDGARFDVLFLHAADEVLLRRFKETRRRHPLEEDGDVREAIRKERALLADLRARADHIIDTDALSVHDLKRLVQERLTGDNARTLNVNLISFGFRHGIPEEADLVLDVRFLDNPHFIPGMKHRSGLDADVAGFVLGLPETTAFLDHLLPMLDFLLPRYEAEGKVYLTIAFGCTGGQHRSVALAERVGRALAAKRLPVRVEHRDRPHWSTPEKQES